MTLRVLSLREPRPSEVEPVLTAARAELSSQAEALSEFATRLDAEFCRALDLISGCRGRVAVCGVGKSGLIGRKLAATFTCSGTPSFFLHPADAAHGDLGMLTGEDVLVLISNSGGTEEIVRLLPDFLEFGMPIVALVGQRDSVLGRAATVALETRVERETCPHNFVPTTSSLVTLALGDALAVAAMRRRNVSAGDLVRFHPGGNLGKRGRRAVADVMLTHPLPLVPPDQALSDVLPTMTTGQCGLVIAVDSEGRPLGIVTDGDLRRALMRQRDLGSLSVSDVMTRDPVTVREDAELSHARERMHRLRLKALVVVDAEQRVSGVVEVFSDV
ncbi:MAG TPA: KpsF/GutQ family sugar-phosphate isomerase [Polyangiaceae bacterium]